MFKVHLTSHRLLLQSWLDAAGSTFAGLVAGAAASAAANALPAGRPGSMAYMAQQQAAAHSRRLNAKQKKDVSAFIRQPTDATPLPMCLPTLQFLCTCK